MLKFKSLVCWIFLHTINTNSTVNKQPGNEHPTNFSIPRNVLYCFHFCQEKHFLLYLTPELPGVSDALFWRTESMVYLFLNPLHKEKYYSLNPATQLNKIMQGYNASQKIDVAQPYSFFICWQLLGTSWTHLMQKAI